MESIKFKPEILDGEKSEVHLLPFKLQYTGDTDVKSFFSNSIMPKKDRDEKFESKN